AFPAAHGDIDIVDGASFRVRPGETMGLVGESGSGKSVTALAMMGLLPRTARISGQVRLGGTDLLSLSPAKLNARRGHEIAMIYQDALSSLNPSMLIRSQLKQLTNRGGTRSAEDLLDLVGLDAGRTLAAYPHELSGGQRQRVLIAMALTRDPSLVIADEPTTALDVTVQKQVVDLLGELREELGFAMVFVSHDLALVAQMAHHITVMYAGQVVEQASTRDLLIDPRHEYTRGLLGSVLSIEAGAERLHQVPGTVPSPRFRPRRPCRTALRRPRGRPDCATAPGAARRQRPPRRHHRGRAPCVHVPRGRQVMNQQRTSVPVIELTDVHVVHKLRTGGLLRPDTIRAVDGVSASVRRGEVLGVVGESGSGKSTLARVMTGLQPVTSGKVHFHGRPMRRSRGTRKELGRTVSVVFQDPSTALNPRLAVKETLLDPL